MAQVRLVKILRINLFVSVFKTFSVILKGETRQILGSQEWRQQGRSAAAEGYQTHDYLQQRASCSSETKTGQIEYIACQREAWRAN